MRHFLLSGLFLSVLGFAFPAAAQESWTDGMRLTAGIPVYVWHPHDRPRNQSWNEGWFHNEGVFIDGSWAVAELDPDTNLRAGFTVGAFDNSLYDFAAFGGGMLEIETYVAPRWSFGFGTYAGLITGYDTSPAPAIAPYFGTAYEVSEKLELGLRGFWLPAETIAGSDLAPSDAYVGAFTIGTRF